MKWIKANYVKPREGWHNAKYGGDECVIDVNNGEIIITFPNGIIETTPRLDILEWLDESASLPSSSVTGEEDALDVAEMFFETHKMTLKGIHGGDYLDKEDFLKFASTPVTGESEAIVDFLQELQFQPYPEDIFTPVSKEDLAKIHLLLKKEMKMPLDRLTGHIGRELRKPIIESAIRISNLYKQSKK